MRIQGFVAGAALAVAVVGTSLGVSLAPTPAYATTGPFSLEMDPLAYYAYMANPGPVNNVPYQPFFGH